MKANPRINWGFLILLGMGGAACAGVYEFAINIIDNNQAWAASSHTDELGVEKTIVSPNIYQVKESGVEMRFNFASGQLISRTQSTEQIDFFSAMNRDQFVQSTLAEACALAGTAQEKLKSYNSISLLPWEDDEITRARGTAREFSTRHCALPIVKGPAL